MFFKNTGMTCKLFLTFDHELPLGGVKTSYKEALFDPTYKLLNIADELNVPVTLFSDVLCAYKFSEWDKNNFFEAYKDQLQQALYKNHDVQLHIHPHWLTSSFDGKTYVPSKDFKLSDFIAHPEWNTGKIIGHGAGFLKKICAVAQDDYQCIAFRAGGYNLEPGSDQIFQNLIEQGIRFDSSICKNYRFSSALSAVDYRGMPEAPNWFIGPDGHIKKTSDTGVLEIPIAGIPKTIFEVPTRFKLKKYSSQAPVDHGFQIHQGKQGGMMNSMSQLFSDRMLTFDNYTYSLEYLMKILEYNMKKYRHYDEIMMCAIGHPKTMSDYAMKLFRSFVLKVREKYQDQLQFCTYRQLNNDLKNT